jgi:Putative lumazine-binding
MKIVGNLLGVGFTDYFTIFEHQGNWIIVNKASFLHADGKLVAC